MVEGGGENFLEKNLDFEDVMTLNWGFGFDLIWFFESNGILNFLKRILNLKQNFNLIKNFLEDNFSPRSSCTHSHAPQRSYLSTNRRKFCILWRTRNFCSPIIKGLNSSPHIQRQICHIQIKFLSLIHLEASAVSRVNEWAPERSSIYIKTIWIWWGEISSKIF